MCNSPQPGGPPQLLLLATQPWPTGARLGLAMRAVGFRVSIWGPSTHPLLITDAFDRHYPYGTFEPLESLEAAVIAAQPDLVVPCDDLAIFRLQQLAERAQHSMPRLQRVLDLVERSLGTPSELYRITSRTNVLAIAAEGGVAVPASARIVSGAELRAWFSIHGFPAYLKADGTSGGIGIRPVHTFAEAAAALRALDAPPRALRAFKRLAIDRDPTLLGPLVRRQRPSISVQRAVAGTEANSAIFCWQGRVLADISMQVLATRYERGPSTVLRRIRNAAMDRAAEILASRLMLTGFYGLDFILDEEAGTAWLIEMNSRATQIAHLALGPGHDLPAAAFAAVTSLVVNPRAAVTTKDTIALFPQEWQRGPASPLIENAYHDEPWESPALVRAYIGRRPSWRRLLTQQYWRERHKQKPNFEAAVSSETTAPRLP
jgi:hypothetical protein